MTTYTVEIDESDQDLKLLSNEHYSVQLAKSVAAGGGDATFNVVYMSTDLAPHMTISWETTYGLNWTTSMSTSGARVNYAGDWQKCGLGQSYTLSPEGSWVVAQKDPNADKKALNVASNDYAKEVHILVGVMDSNGEWKPIWVDTDALLKGSHGEYEPLETINIWFEEGEKTATMISQQGTPKQVYDMTPTPFYFSYDAGQGVWRTPQDTAINF